MEKRLNTKTRAYLQQFKEDIKSRVLSMDCAENNSSDITGLMQYIYDYQPLEFQKADLQKRKRIKNIVPFYDRCCALRANKEQCTRRKKDGEKFESPDKMTR
jgi:hypothetical protein